MCRRAGVWAALLCGLSCDGGEDSGRKEVDSGHMESGGTDDAAVIDARDAVARLMDEGFPSYSGLRGVTAEGGLFLGMNWAPDGDLRGRAYVWDEAVDGDQSLADSSRIIDTGNDSYVQGAAPLSGGRLAFSKYGEAGALEVSVWSASSEVDTSIAFEASVLVSGDLSGDGELDLVAAAGDASLMGREIMLLDGNERGALTWDDRMAGITLDADGELLALNAITDSNGDGFDELQVQASGGRALVFRGPISGDLAVGDADATITGLSDAIAGPHRYAPSSIGDFDGDGLSDLAYWDEERVEVWLFGLAVDGAHDEAQAIASLTVSSARGDVNQPFNPVGGLDLDVDGKADLLIPWTYAEAPGESTYLWWVPGGQRGPVDAGDAGRTLQFSWYDPAYEGVGVITDLGGDDVLDVAMPGSSAANILSAASIAAMLGVN